VLSHSTVSPNAYFIVLINRTAAEAGTVLARALRQYRRPDGYEGYLVDVAEQLAGMGASSWAALQSLARIRASECEYFVGTIVDLIESSPDISDFEKLSVLADLAKNPSLNTRERMLEVLHRLHPTRQKYALGRLAARVQPDDDVTRDARELLASRE
jgi:hypothetical protein